MYCTQIISLLGAYLVGAIPTGFLIAHFCAMRDIRSYGSGNIGATNVARVLGGIYFIPVLLIDAAKAYGYLWLLLSTGQSQLLIACAGLLLVVGNSRSIFLRGQGGKGIATMIGVIAAQAPMLLVTFCIVWVGTYGYTRVPGIASVFSLVAVPLVACIILMTSAPSLCWSLICISLWCLWRHKDNMRSYWRWSV